MSKAFLKDTPPLSVWQVGNAIARGNATQPPRGRWELKHAQDAESISGSSTIFTERDAGLDVRSASFLFMAAHRLTSALHREAGRSVASDGRHEVIRCADVNKVFANLAESKPNSFRMESRRATDP